MGFAIVLAAAAGWLFLCATQRVDGRLRGWRGAVLGTVAATLAVRAFQETGAGLAEAVSETLAVAILAVPCWSYLVARRRRSAAKAAPAARRAP